MKLTTVTLPAIEMTKAEEQALHTRVLGCRGFVEGKEILDWNTDEDHNHIMLAGEPFYRIVVIIP